jgi:excinuclease ABC subunit C
MESSALFRKIEYLPTSPGVYLFKDARGAILYVGKAGNLKHRVSSYFQKRDGLDGKTLALLEKVADIETIVTNTEKEALILENNLIKANRPRYNIKLRDDKNYPILKLSTTEEFPKLTIVRRIERDGSLYFGPYPSATSLKETLRLVRSLFPIRTCRDTKFSNRTRPCINYEMERCSGPCCGKIDPDQYREMIQEVRMFLEGKNTHLLENLKRRMLEASENLLFEKAAKIRDQIQHIEHVIERQRIVSDDFVDRDAVGVYRQDHTIVLYLLFVRGGKILGGKGFSFPSTGLPQEELLSSFLHQYYRSGKFIPDKILLPHDIPESNLLEEELTELKGRRVQLLIPERGEKKNLVTMAEENARSFLLTASEAEAHRQQLLESLKEKLYLRKTPHRIEAFDISNIQGVYAVGSMVTFVDGEPEKDRYRHFKIKTVDQVDDYGMMYEVLLRRYRKALEEGDLPDLVLLDGGKGQLHVAQEVFRELRISDVDLLSLAKERDIKGRSSLRGVKTEEKVFHPQWKEPLILGKHSPLLLFLDRIRDEAHRFAVTHHKKLRGRTMKESVLKEIPGIGPIRERALLKHFGSVERIKEATLEELAQAPTMDRRSGHSVYQFFHSASGQENPKVAIDSLRNGREK